MENMKDFKDKVVVITRGATGIGNVERERSTGWATGSTRTATGLLVPRER